MVRQTDWEVGPAATSGVGCGRPGKPAVVAPACSCCIGEAELGSWAAGSSSMIGVGGYGCCRALAGGRSTGSVGRQLVALMGSWHRKIRSGSSSPSSRSEGEASRAWARTYSSAIVTRRGTEQLALVRVCRRTGSIIRPGPNLAAYCLEARLRGSSFAGAASSAAGARAEGCCLAAACLAAA